MEISYIDPEFKNDLDRFSFNGRGIPEYMKSSIFKYVTEGVIPGGFLQAVICKDLDSMIAKADSQNMWIIPVYYAFFYNCTPSPCWGSEETMSKWNKHQGMKGYHESK